MSSETNHAARTPGFNDDGTPVDPIRDYVTEYPEGPDGPIVVKDRQGRVVSTGAASPPGHGPGAGKMLVEVPVDVMGRICQQLRIECEFDPPARAVVKHALANLVEVSEKLSDAAKHAVVMGPTGEINMDALKIGALVCKSAHEIGVLSMVLSRCGN